MIKTINLHSILLSVVLFCCATAQAQFQPLIKMAKERNAMTFKLEKNNGYIQRIVINESDMDYVMRYKGDNRFFSIRPGKNIIEQFPANSQEAKGKFQQHENILFYPGREVKESKVGKVVYALPVKDGSTIKCKAAKDKVIVNREDSLRVPCVHFQLNEGDSIYAVRTGTVCFITYDRLKSFYVYHNDGSFELYHDLESNLKVGQHIKAGDYVGTKLGQKPFKMFFFYFDQETLKATKLPYKTFSPLFRTSNGDIRIEDNHELHAVIDDKLKRQEK